jgi:predicted nucleic acid-binding Zn ribbon protein
MTFCPICGSEIKNPASGCIHCEKKITEDFNKNREQGKLILLVSAFFLILGIIFPIFLIVGFIGFGSGIIIYLTNRR